MPKEKPEKEDESKEEEGFLKKLLEKADSDLFDSKINKNLVVTNVVIIFCLVLLLVYHLSINQYWTSRYESIRSELEKAKEDMEHYKSSYESIKEDIDKYDDMYEQQTTRLEYSRDINVMEHYYNSEEMENWCVPPIEMEVPSSPTVQIEASARKAKGWPVMHVFINGENQQSFKVDSSRLKTYSFSADMSSDNHYIDIIFNNDYYDHIDELDRSIKIESIKIDGKEIEKGSGFYDAGSGRDAINCISGQSGWDLNSNGALRLHLKEPE